MYGSDSCHEVVRLLAQPVPEVVTTPVVVMELLAGASSETALRSLERLTAGLPSLSLDADVDLHSAAAVYRLARRTGHTVRGVLDCLVAVAAHRHGAVLVHRGADLARIAAAWPALSSRSWLTSG